jgi:hypothetical protein
MSYGEESKGIDLPHVIPGPTTGGVTMSLTKLGIVGLVVTLAAAPGMALADCRLKNDGPMTIFRSGTLDKVYALGKENYVRAVMLYAACASVPSGTKLGMVKRGWFTSSTVIVKEGRHLGCTGDLENEFIECRD